MKNKFFKKTLEKLLMLTAIGTIGFLASCGDDEPVAADPSSIGFASTTGSVDENGAAITVSLTSSIAAPSDGTVTVSLSGATYGDDYTTSGGSASFELSITAGSTIAAFDITPVDNDLFDGDKTISVTLSGATGGVTLGSATSYTLTIVDDEMYDDISSIRALFDANAADGVAITNDLIISGVVTSSLDATGTRNLFIQDASGAIAMRFDEDHDFDQGTSLLVSLMGASVSHFRDLVQVTAVSNASTALPLANATNLGAGTMPNATVISIDQLNSDAFQAQYVTLENVSFPDADGVMTSGGNNDVTDGTSTSTVRVSGSLSEDLLPIGTGNVTGVAGIFSGAAQLLPQAAGDVFANNPTATITVTSAITDFGSIESNVTSASQSYTVSGTGLTENILVTAPGQFEVSLDDAAFSASVEVDATMAMAGDVTVYARFAPTSGFDASVTGEIMHSSAGGINQLVAVSGTEVGAAPANILFTDNFDYGSTAGLLVNGDVADGVGASVWTAHSGGTSSTQVGYATSSLSMTGYGSSGVGGSATISGSGEDINASFAEQTSGAFYGAALMNISAAASGDYFFHFKDDGFGLYGRVYVKDDGAGGLLFGLREGSGGTGSIVYSTTARAINTTYLVVLKYDFTAGAATLYVLDNAAATEPSTPEVTIDDATDATTLSAIAFREGSNTPDATIDGIRVATDWDGVIGN